MGSCKACRVAPRLQNSRGETLPKRPPQAFLYVAASNIVYFVLAAYFMIQREPPGGWPFLLVGLASFIFHLYPTQVAEVADIVLASLAIGIVLAIYAKRVKNARLAAVALVCMLVGLFLLFRHGPGSLTIAQRENPHYIRDHIAWHVLSALSAALFVLSTK